MSNSLFKTGSIFVERDGRNLRVSHIRLDAHQSSLPRYRRDGFEIFNDGIFLYTGRNKKTLKKSISNAIGLLKNNVQLKSAEKMIKLIKEIKSVR